MSDFRPVPRRKQRLGDEVYGQILERILSGELGQGDKLPSEAEICRSSQVSRPTVREALMRLHADGLVTTRQGSGTYVLHRPSEHLSGLAVASDIAEMQRCFEVRLALESQAAGLAARRRTPEQVDGIYAALDALRAAFAGGSVPAKTDFDFHLAVAGASGNPLFVEILETLNGTIRQIMAVALRITHTGSQERARRVFDEHEAIAEAIRQGDAEAAALTMRYHLHRARQRMTEGQRDL